MVRREHGFDSPRRLHAGFAPGERLAFQASIDGFESRTPLYAAKVFSVARSVANAEVRVRVPLAAPGKAL